MNEKGEIRLIQGDITECSADAIVNAANAQLAGGGGVDGAIHRAGGPSILEQCRKIGRCATGSAVVTEAGTLHARFVFHAVGPVYSGRPEDPQLLYSAYTKCMELCPPNGVKTIVFPSLSTGAYGYPVREAAPIALGAIGDFLGRNPGVVEQVTFALFDRSILKEFETAKKELIT